MDHTDTKQVCEDHVWHAHTCLGSLVAKLKLTKMVVEIPFLDAIMHLT